MLLLTLLACGPGMRLAWWVDAGNYAPVPAPSPSGTMITSTYEPYSQAYSVVGFQPSDGAREWSYHLDSGGSCPLIVDDTGHVLLGTQGALLALDAADGTEAWRLEVEGRVEPALAVDGERIYAMHQAGTERTLLAVDQGALSWELPLDARSLAVGRDGVLYTSCDAAVTAIASDGEVLWSSPTDHRAASMILSRNLIVLTSVHREDAGTYEYVTLRREDGRLAWTWESPTWGWAIAGEDAIYASGSGFIAALDEYSGGVLWQEEYWTGPISLGGDGRLYAMTQGPEWEGDGSSWRYFFSVIDAGDGSLLWQELQSIHHSIDSINGSPSFDAGDVYFSGGYFGAVIYRFQGGPGPGKGPWTREAGGNGNQRREQ